jgi:hypothetical protein
MLIILLFCLVVITGLLSLGMMVWFVVLGIEEGRGQPTVCNLGGLDQKAYISHELAARTKRRSMLISRGNSSATATNGWHGYR